jgi:hypothetical protein
VRGDAVVNGVVVESPRTKLKVLRKVFEAVLVHCGMVCRFFGGFSDFFETPISVIAV